MTPKEKRKPLLSIAWFMVAFFVGVALVILAGIIFASIYPPPH